jgi:hypothetical protein
VDRSEIGVPRAPEPGDDHFVTDPGGSPADQGDRVADQGDRVADPGDRVADPGDRALAGRLGELLERVDPVPAWLVEAATGVFGLRRLELDAEFAALAYDSTVDEPELALRSGEGPRLLAFEAAGLRVEVEVADVGDGRRMLGQVVPRGPGRVELRGADGRTRVEAEIDPAGRFVVEQVPSGAVSLVCRPVGSRPTMTAWTTLG